MSLVRRLFSAGLLLSLIILIGRLTGFVREIRVGSLFGLSNEADLAVILLTTPDLLVNLLLAGGMSAALIPEFARLGRAERAALFFRVTAIVALAFGLIAILLATFPQVLLLFLAPGYAFAPLGDAHPAFAIAAVAIPFAGVTGVTAALLNADQRFLIAGAGTLVFNATVIAMLSVNVANAGPLLVLAVAIAAAAILRYAIQLIASFRHLRPVLRLDGVDGVDLLRRFAATLTASTLILLFPVVVRSLLSLGGAGNIAAFNFATKLVELPSGIVLTTLSTVALPALSRLLAEDRENEARQMFVQQSGLALGLALAIMLPAAIFAYPVTDLLFGYGRMGPDEIRQIGDFGRVCIFSLPGIALTSMAMAMLNAQRRTGTLLRLTLVATAVLALTVTPGVLLANPLLTAAALPFTNAVLAGFLLRAVGGDVVSPVAGRLCLAMVAIAAIAGLSVLVGSVMRLSGSFVESVLAGVAMVASLLVVAYLLGRRGERAVGEARS